MICQQKAVNCGCLNANCIPTLACPERGGHCVNAYQACTFPAPLQELVVTPKQASWSITGMPMPAEWGMLILQHFPKLSQYIWWILSKEADQIPRVKIKWILWMLQWNVLTNNTVLMNCIWILKRNLFVSIKNKFCMHFIFFFNLWNECSRTISRWPSSCGTASQLNFNWPGTKMPEGSCAAQVTDQKQIL